MKHLARRILWPPTLGLGLAQAWAAARWRRQDGTGATLALLVWGVTRPLYVAAYHAFVWVAS